MISRLLRTNTQSGTNGIALALIAVVLIYNGTLDVPDLSPNDERWLVATCLIGGSVSLILSMLCLARRFTSPRALETAMSAGLVAAVLANFVTGDLWPDSLWITCGYTMTLTIASGLTLRNPFAFAGLMALLLASWLTAVNMHSDQFDARGDATTLVVIGGFIALGVFWILRIERQAQDSLTRQLRSQLDHDALTGVLNRTGMHSRLETLREDSGGEGRVWCAYVDVDFFKSINDRRGHDYGDEVLRAIAKGLVAACGEEDLVSRWGGDEFVIVGDGEPPSEPGIENRVILTLGNRKLDASVTVGVTSIDWSGYPGPEALIELADLRMYKRRDNERSLSPGQIEISMERKSPPPST